MGGWFNKKINTIDDFKGLKMRIPGLGGKVLAKAGGTVVLTPGGEIFTNLERGVIDATEWVGPLHDFEWGFTRPPNTITTPAGMSPGPIWNLSSTKSLRLPAQRSSAHRRRRLHGQDSWSLPQFEAENGAALQELINKHNVDLIRFPDDVLAKLRVLAVEVNEEEAAKKAPSE